jgi:hypothetical protein
MSLTHTITRAYRDSSGNSITSTENITDDSENDLDIQIAVSTTNELINWNAIRADLKSLSISCDQALTIKTNSSGSPTDTITLSAGQNIIWSYQTDGLSHCPFSADITTGIYVTNPSSTLVANFKIRAIQHV